MIHVDETDPIEEPEPTFPYKLVEIRRDEKLIDRYELLSEELGRGTFGTVYLCREKSTGLELAGKIVECPKKEDRTNMELEIELMSGLHHPRIIQLYDAFDDGFTISVLLELIRGGELFDRVISDDFELTEKACTIFVKQICEGVEFIHKNNILHLDLKPENVLCLSTTGNRIKIIDFGMARRFDPAKKLQVLFGTPEFTAPEVVAFDPIGFFTDMWSIGVICYVLLSGLSPFMGESDIDTMTNVTLGKFDFKDPSFDQISDNAKDFINKLLMMDGSKRLSATEALKHPWLISIAQDTTLSISKGKLKRYVIKKRWIKAVNTIIALKRMGAKLDFSLL